MNPKTYCTTSFQPKGLCKYTVTPSTGVMGPRFRRSCLKLFTLTLLLCITCICIQRLNVLLDARSQFPVYSGTIRICEQAPSRGVLLQAFHTEQPRGGMPYRYLVEAALAARRSRRALNLSRDEAMSKHDDLSVFLVGCVRFALATSRKQHEYMLSTKQCVARACSAYREMVAGPNPVFDNITYYEDLPEYSTIVSSFRAASRERKVKKSPFQVNPLIWQLRYLSWLHSPYQHTLALNSDAHACTGFHALLDYLMETRMRTALDRTFSLTPFLIHGNQNTKHAGSHEGEIYQLVTQFDENGGYGGSFGCSSCSIYSKKWNSRQRRSFSSHDEWQERCLGTIAFHSGSPAVQSLLLLASRIYKTQIFRMLSNHSLSFNVKHDQPAFREALFIQRNVMNRTIREITIPLNTICRKGFNDCRHGCLIVHRHKRVSGALSPDEEALLGNKTTWYHPGDTLLNLTTRFSHLK